MVVRLFHYDMVIPLLKISIYEKQQTNLLTFNLFLSYLNRKIDIAWQLNSK